jgi:hypothetical protein
LKRTFPLTILALVIALLSPLAATSQVAPTRRAATTNDEGEPIYKYKIYAGYGYTSLNQVNQSRYGLQGVEATLTRDFGKYFALAADGGYYKPPIAGGNPGDPLVDVVLFGPEFHAPIYGHYSGFFRGLIGGEHTGGEGMTPNISFAGGIGGGIEYSLRGRLAVRASGDDIASSFSLNNNTPLLAYSPHEHWNARASIGVVYKF